MEAAPEPTIAAIATPPGAGGIAVVRISGQTAYAVADACFSTTAGPLGSLPAQTLHYGSVTHPVTREVLDRALALLFRAPRSYTGEDTVEFCCHGGPAVVTAVLAAVIAAGARPAEPGEFTRRAYQNGRIDLAQAEAVCDLVSARTDQARRLALRQHGGALSARVGALRESTVNLLASIEATLDFGDEVDAPDRAALASAVEAARADIEGLLCTADRGRLYREGRRLVLCGRPNVGKSSLLNALLRDNRAIVTEVPGTTRDAIEAELSIAGVPVTAVDTAGLRATDDAVEAIGVSRAREAVAGASLVLVVVDASARWTDDDARVLAEAAPGRALVAANKCDLLADVARGPRLAALAERCAPAPVTLVSALTGDGLPALEESIAEAIAGGRQVGADEVVVTNVRHAGELEQARDSLEAAAAALQADLPLDIMSTDLRAAIDALGRITGQTATPDIVERVFAAFCIGK